MAALSVVTPGPTTATTVGETVGSLQPAAALGMQSAGYRAGPRSPESCTAQRLPTRLLPNCAQALLRLGACAVHEEVVHHLRNPAALLQPMRAQHG